MNIIERVISEAILKILWYIVLGMIASMVLIMIGLQEYALWAILPLFIWIALKKVDVSEKNANSYLMKFWGTKKREAMLSDNEEEAEQQINNLIEKINAGEYSIPVPIRLNDNEKAYLMMSGAEWHETRSTTRSISYGNIQQTFKLTDGLKIRLGNVKPIPHKKSEFTKIASGDFYITNKRIMLVSPTETRKIEKRDLVNINLFKDGILIQKDSGKAVLIPMQEEAAIISKAILDNI